MKFQDYTSMPHTSVHCTYIHTDKSKPIFFQVGHISMATFLKLNDEQLFALEKGDRRTQCSYHGPSRDWEVLSYIMQTCPCNFDPLTPHFYIVKLGFTRVCIIFLFLL